MDEWMKQRMDAQPGISRMKKGKVWVNGKRVISGSLAAIFFWRRSFAILWKIFVQNSLFTQRRFAKKDF
jgi:hypothetical protein